MNRDHPRYDKLKKWFTTLIRRKSELFALLEISTRLTGSYNFQVLLQTITDSAAKILPHGASVIYLLKDTTFHVAAATSELSPNLPEKFRTLSLSDHPHICRAMDTDSPVILANIRKAELTAAEKWVSDLLGLSSLIYLPLIYKEKPIGVLLVGNVEKPYRFVDEDVDFLKTMANHISLEIEDARLFEENQRHIAELECVMKKQQQTQKALQESESLFRNSFQKHAAVKLIIDPDDGRIVDANEAAAKFYGWSQKELRRMNISDINQLSSSQIKAEIDKVRNDKRVYFEFQHRRADGSIRDVAVYSSEIESGGKTLLHSIIHDITERKRTEKERNSLQKQLMQAQKLESIGRLAGGVAHDFNNMLNVIIGYGELILDKLQPGNPMQVYVEEIVKAGYRSAFLTRQLLAFSRKQTLQPKEFDLNDLVRNIEKMIRRLIGEDIELKIVLAQDIGRVLVDPGQIDQVIMNLVVNARDAMPKGGKLFIETAVVDLDKTSAEKRSLVKPGKYVLLAVTDTGCGMNKEILNLIFDPFFTTKKKGQGTGLGLSTVYGIVKQSHGNIWVYSEPGQGTTFKIYLPQIEMIQEVVAEKREEVDLSGGDDKHILVVEDEESLRKLINSILLRLGYTVTLAADGNEALLLVEEKGLKPDLILTDMVMPNMSGKELVDCLRKNCPDLKVLYMSGYTANAIVHEEVIDHGSSFIRKPFTIGNIKAKIRNVLNSDDQ